MQDYALVLTKMKCLHNLLDVIRRKNCKDLATSYTVQLQPIDR